VLNWAVALELDPTKAANEVDQLATAIAQRPELGWRLASGTWGRGLATEAATAARDDAFQRLALAELISIIHPENTRSRRLAGKLGMSLERQIDNPVLDRKVDVWQTSP